MVLFEIFPANSRPIRFRNEAYIRIGSSKKKESCGRFLIRFPSRGIAKEGLGSRCSFSYDYPAYFDIMHQPLPENRSSILQKLLSEKLILRADDGTYNITNVGAILFAKNIEDFDQLIRKAPRVVVIGDHRAETIKEHRVNKGYAIGFKEIINYINDQLPQNEEIGQAFRREVRMYPAIAIRELVANALIHQNFTITGEGHP